MNRFKIPSVLIILLFTASIAVGQINWTENTIAVGFDYANHVYPVDLDQDGDMDAVGTASGTPDVVAWFENDGNMNFTQRDINANFSGAWSAHVIDVDNDGDLDVVAAAFSVDKISWFENNGSQVFTEHVVSSNFDLVVSAYADDIDRDGDVDILGAASTPDQIRWWENNGSQVFTEHYVTQSLDGAWRAVSADMDGDNDIDVLGCGNTGDLVAWYENDGQQNFTPHNIAVGFDGPQSALPIDLDSDGDMDVVAGAASGDIVAWFENDGNMNFIQHNIATMYDYPRSVFAIDLDQDRDVDVLAAANSANLITWFENDGNQSFTRHDIRTAYSGALCVNAADMDLDGDIDVLGAAAGANLVNWWASDLGPATGLTLTLTPHNPPIVIPSGGGSFFMDATIENLNTDPVSFDAWTMVLLPNGVPYGPLIERTGLVIPPGATIMRTLSQNVPAPAPPGNYSYQGHVMTLPDSIVITDSFPFTKLAGEGAPNHNQGWACYGWDDEKSHITNHKSKITNLAVSPNPFNPMTEISFILDNPGNVSLTVYDVSGREVVTLAQGWMSSGMHSAVFDGTELSSGVYLASLRAAGTQETMKLLLVK